MSEIFFRTSVHLRHMTNSTEITDINEIPPIYVSEPGFDNMAAILNELDISYNQLNWDAMDDEERGIVMLNCHSKWTTAPSSRESKFAQFVSQGGSAIVSDFAGEVIQGFTRATFDRSTSSKTITATVTDAELADILGTRKVDLTFDMMGWYKPMTMPREGQALLENARKTDDDNTLAYQFPYGQGEVVYTAFHNHAQISDVEKALLRLLLIIPIAESTGSTVTNTYHELVKQETEPERKTESSDDGSHASAADSRTKMEPEESASQPNVERLDADSESVISKSQGEPTVKRVDTDAEETRPSFKEDDSTEHSIAIVLDEKVVEPEEPVGLTVRSGSGNRVSGVTIEYPGGKTETDSRGRCAISFEEEGTKTIKAYKTANGEARMTAQKVVEVK